MAFLAQARQLLSTQYLEVFLEHAKRVLNRVPLGAICHVEDPTEPQLLHSILALIGLVRGKIVHEKSYLLAFGSLTKLF